jgi:signal transduction histidine kinase
MDPENEGVEQPIKAYGMNRFSFSTRVKVMFALTSVMTAVVLMAVLLILWGIQFQSYSDENLENLSRATATTLEQRYSLMGGWNAETIAALPAISQISDGVQITVADKNGLVLSSTVTSPGTPAASAGVIGNPAVKAAPIAASGTTVGTVYVAPDASSALSESDREYRSYSIIGIIVAAIVAVGLSVLVGFGAVKMLVKPITMITDTVREIRAGNLAARTNMGGYDELGKLGKTLDEMAGVVEMNQSYERQITVDIAHELRTPLMAMQATIEAMIDGVLPTGPEQLATLDSEIRRLARLVNQQMRLSKLERRAVEMSEEEINLGDLIAGLVIAHEMLAEEADLAITFKADPSVFVYGDADLLRQATANLISNAVRFTPAGGTISITILHGQLMARIVVADTGIGISPDDIKNVFTKFWRAEGDRNRESGGLGIGLAMVKEIVDMHKGWVNVESVLGEGTTFTIYIPLYTETLRRRNRQLNKES